MLQKTKKLKTMIGTLALVAQVEMVIQHNFLHAIDILGPITVCKSPDTMTLIGMWIKETANIAYNISPTASLKFINHGGYYRYGLYALNSKTQENCFVTPSIAGATGQNQPKRRKLFYFLMTPTKISATEYNCQITTMFAPLNTVSGGIDLVPCPNPVNSYTFIDEFFPVTKNNIPQSYTSIPSESMIIATNLPQINIASHQPAYIEIFKAGLSQTTMVHTDYFDDDFVEMLVLGQANKPAEPFPAGIYFDDRYVLVRNALARRNPGKAFIKPKQFLEKISLKGRSGYHLDPDNSRDYHSYARTNGFAHHFQNSRFYKAQFYITKPSGISGSRMVVVDVGQYSQGTNPGMREHKHQIRIHRDIGDPSKLRFSLYETSGVATQKVGFLIDYYSDNRWIHFGMIVGEGLLYYDKDTNEGVFKVFQTLFAMHTDATKTPPINKNFAIVSEYTKMPISLFGMGGVYHSFEAKIRAFQDLAMTTSDPNDYFEILLFDYNWAAGAMLASSSFSSITQIDPENRCMVPAYEINRCIAFAYLHYFYDSSLAKHDSSLYYNRFGGFLMDRPPGPLDPGYNPKKGCDGNCLFCFEENNCLVPKTGFNRELVTNQVEHLGKATTLLSVYEGGDQTNGRIKFINSAGDVYWVKCPPGCNLHFQTKRIIIFIMFWVAKYSLSYFIIEV